MPSGGLHGEQRSLDTIDETSSADTPVARAPPPPAGAFEGPASHEESPHGQSSQCLKVLAYGYLHNKLGLLFHKPCDCKEPKMSRGVLRSVHHYL